MCFRHARFLHHPLLLLHFLKTTLFFHISEKPAHLKAAIIFCMIPGVSQREKTLIPEMRPLHKSEPGQSENQVHDNKAVPAQRLMTYNLHLMYTGVGGKVPYTYRPLISKCKSESVDREGTEIMRGATRTLALHVTFQGHSTMSS